MILAAASLRLYLGDDVTDEESLARADAAQRLVEEFLRRPLASAEHTETLRVERDPLRRAAAVAYPTYSPVTAIDPDSGDDLSIVDTVTIGIDGGVVGWGDCRREITYTAGWTRDTLPEKLRRAIAETYAALRDRVPSNESTALADAGIPDVGDEVSSVSLDGASVSFRDRTDANRDGGQWVGSVPRHVQVDINGWRRR